MSLCDHLGADKDLRLPIPEFLQDLFHATSTGDGIAVEAIDADFRKQSRQGFLHAFGSRRTLAQARELALRATVGDSPLFCTVVTLSHIPVFVVGERDIAAVAAKRVPTLSAVNIASKTPAIQKQEHLLLTVESLPDQIDQSA